MRDRAHPGRLRGRGRGGRGGIEKPLANPCLWRFGSSMHAQSTRKHHSRSAKRKASTAELLLAWYDANRRELAWRAKPGEAVDPYRVWLSEIMLQQTTVAAVAPYYRAFLVRWPGVGRLAAASQDEGLAAWARLCYYSRARNLHRAARVVAKELGGIFPGNATGL